MRRLSSPRRIGLSLWTIVIVVVASFCKMLSACAYQGGSSCRQSVRLAFLQWSRSKYQRRRTVSLAFPNGDNESSLREKLDAVEQQILNLNDGQYINVNSPKQVATAVFGKVQSTSRDVLHQAANGKLKDLENRSQQLAALVLQYRELSRITSAPTNRRPTPTRQRKPFSTLSNTAVNGDSLPKPDSAERTSKSAAKDPISSTSDERMSVMSTYARQVESLFVSSRIHDYWKEPLLQVTRPSAQALVSQLDSTTCPMGYHPLAVPHDLLLRSKLSESTTAGKKGSFLAFCREQKEKYPDCM